MQDSGWTCSHRKKWTHPIFQNSAIRVGVWDWMIQMAAWKNVRHRTGGQTVTLQRGQLCVSQEQICRETGMSRKALRTFLMELESECAVVCKRANGAANARTVITICNYDVYQSSSEENGPTKGQQKASEGPTKEQGNNPSVSSKRACAKKSVDPKKVVFDSGINFLGQAGRTEREARGIIGKWVKAHGVGEVIDALSVAKSQGVIEPIGWIEARWKTKTAHLDNDGAILNHGIKMRKARPPARPKEREPC